MNYADGRRVEVGDRVKLWNQKLGKIVCSIDTRDFTKKFLETEWSYLGSGVIIETDTGEIFHYTEPDEDFRFIKSGAAPAASRSRRK
jgi:hypothetical protein